MIAATSSLAMMMQDAYQYEGGGGAMAIIPMLISLAIAIFFIVTMWKIFTKAGEAGWASIIPIYNVIVLLKIVAKPLWWFILLCIPVVNFIVAIIVTLELAKRFGKGTGFAVGMILLPVIFYPILAFGDARYSA